MATVAHPQPHLVPHAAAARLRPVWGWLATVDHKRIAQLYFYTAFAWFLIGGLEAELIRWQLRRPDSGFVSAETYNQLFTMHGTTMIFLAIMPLSAGFFNLLIPLQIGARDVAFPRLNAFTYWLYLFGSVVLNVSWLMHAAPNAGWFAYAPLTTRAYSPGINIDFWVIGIQILGISTLASAFNFITTIINLRAPGMSLMRMPVFTWAAFCTQFLIILAFPFLTVAVSFLLFDRFFGMTFYTTAAGADPLLWQHLFWIFGHPEVYILILPAFGLVSEVLPTFARKPLFGYPAMVYSLILIAFLSYGVWAHHMFAVGLGPVADSIFGLTSMLIAIPTGIKIFNWLATIWDGALHFTTAMLFALGLIALFTIGGISGVMHASSPLDLQQTDSYFVVAHIHYVLFGGSMMGIFAGIYYYFPKMTGRLLDERLGKVHFWLTFVAMNLAFFPMHLAGLDGMPRRIYTYQAHQGWDADNLTSTVGAILLGIATLVLVINAIRSRSAGQAAGNDPWGAPTLEWTTTSPPPPYNFVVLPTVTSRYPLWERTGPGPVVTVPHDSVGERTTHNAIDGQPTGTPPTLRTGAPSVQQMPPVTGVPPVPTPTVRPLVAAAGLAVAFAGLLYRDREAALAQGGTPSHVLSLAITLGGAALFVWVLIAWLLAPLEAVEPTPVA